MNIKAILEKIAEVLIEDEPVYPPPLTLDDDEEEKKDNEENQGDQP